MLNFPDSPTDGDIFQGYIYDATRGVWDVKLASDPLGTINIVTPTTGDALIFDGTNWINQEIVTNPYSTSTSATDFFALPKGTTAQRPVTPNNGDIRFNTESGEPEWYSENMEDWISFHSKATSDFQYLVIAGGGGGGGFYSGSGAGAGGYRSSVVGELSGTGTPAESPLALSDGDVFSVAVGAGGGGGAGTATYGFRGSDSSFHTIVSSGGGAGGAGGISLSAVSANGGSGGGGIANVAANPGGLGVVSQGTAGGDAYSTGPNYGSGGGGGALTSGGTGSSNSSGDGGSGLSSSITGTSIARGGGGGGGTHTNTVPGQGGNGGGGNGGVGGGNNPGFPGAASTGGGGGGGTYQTSTALVLGGAGGSGIVIIKYPSKFSLTVGAGLTSATAVVGSYKVTQFTAGTDQVTVG